MSPRSPIDVSLEKDVDRFGGERLGELVRADPTGFVAMTDGGDDLDVAKNRASKRWKETRAALRLAPKARRFVGEGRVLDALVNRQVEQIVWRADDDRQAHVRADGALLDLDFRLAGTVWFERDQLNGLNVARLGEHARLDFARQHNCLPS